MLNNAGAGERVRDVIDVKICSTRYHYRCVPCARGMRRIGSPFLTRRAAHESSRCQLDSAGKKRPRERRFSDLMREMRFNRDIDGLQIRADAVFIVNVKANHHGARGKKSN